MSMPKLPEPNPNLTREQALAMILSSIALEEAALAHIMNAEGEKIQHMLNQAHCGDSIVYFNNILEVNKSVTNLLEMVQQNQTILKNKMEKVLEYLPQPSCWPKPPFPPISDCDIPDGMPLSFCVAPRVYRCNEPLLWSEKNIYCDTITYPSDLSKIQLPTGEPLLLGFYVEPEGAMGHSNVLELIITCRGINLIRLKVTPGRWPGHPGFFKKTVVEMPSSCTTCHATVFVRAPQGMRRKQGGFFFTRFRADVQRTPEIEPKTE